MLISCGPGLVLSQGGGRVALHCSPALPLALCCPPLHPFLASLWKLPCPWLVMSSCSSAQRMSMLLLVAG